MSLDRLAEAAAAIADAESLALACHIGPDGDALGSMLGFGLAAREQGKEVVAGFGSPTNLPGTLRFLPGQELLVPLSDFPGEPEVMVVFDTGSAARIGELAANAEAASTLVVVDHHVTNEGFGDIAVVEGAVAATGEIVFRLLGELGWPVTEEVAQCLLTALMTDTGRFQYSNTTPETMRIAADLIELGARPEVIARHVYEEAPFGYLVASGNALARAQLDTDASVVWTIVTDADLESAGIDWEDTDGIIDSLRLAEEADVALLVKAHSDGRVRVSLRSRGATDVGSLASDLGGGGHRLAAGFNTKGDPVRLVEKVVGMVGSYR